MRKKHRARVTSFFLNPRLLRYKTGRYFKGELERLRLAIKSKRVERVYLYMEMPDEPVTLYLAPEEIPNAGTLNLVGVYDKKVTSEMLREDLPWNQEATI